MAEGIEEQESNNSNADTPAMLGTVLPCEAITAALGGMKREYDVISGGGGVSGTSGNSNSGFSYTATSPTSSLSPTINQTQISNKVSSTSTTTALSIRATSSPVQNSINTSKTNDLFNTKGLSQVTTSTVTTTSTGLKSPTLSTSSISSGIVNPNQPVNFKIEEEEQETNQIKNPSITPPILISGDKDEQNSIDFYKNLVNNNNNNNNSKSNNNDISTNNNNRSNSPNEHDKVKAAIAAAQAHLNGTMQDMLNLQKLQNLTSLQHQQQQQKLQHSSVPAAAAALASLQGLAGISSTINSPLNLTIGSNLSPAAAAALTSKLPSNSNGNTNMVNNISDLVGCNSPSGSQMPQLILASGQLVQGVQGAQLLIPTPQGIAVQTILTIPVSQQISTNEQFLQNYAALNNGSSPFNLGASHQMHLNAQQNMLKPNFLPTGVQQLLSALHPQLFNQSATSPQQIGSDHNKSVNLQQMQLHQTQQKQQNQQQSQQQMNNLDTISPKLEQSTHQRNSSRDPSPHHSRNSPLRHSSPRDHQKETNSPLLTVKAHLGIDKSNIGSASSTQQISTNSYSSPSGSHLFRNSHSPNAPNASSSNSHSLSSQGNSTATSSVLSNINRLSSTNGELTITKSHGPQTSMAGPLSPTSGSMSHHQQHQHSSSSSSIKMNQMSPSSSIHRVSPSNTDNSVADLLIDSPNEPTINQATCNVVDGIDLDEIKEFAKAFKLRRLSLGLTQTQVGQALSVTEGPAYSQSAICSALAAQMYAAQLSSQQQSNMFEKLDITPKSAQKIKPVLERWMKEAEESHWNRYKTGQNHLTDFIGVEPSKKRKRRTSFTPQALELLNAHFERNTHPSGTEITGLAHQLGYEREVIRIWFCNKRQALKNTVRMMSKGMV